MSTIKQKNAAKSSAAIAAGVVGAGAAYATMRGETPAGAEHAPVTTTASAAPVQQAAQTVDHSAEPAQIDQLVQSYLGDGQSGVPNADALTAADISDLLPEPEMLDALASYPSAQVAQVGAEGIGGLFTGLGESIGLSGGLATAGGIGLGVAGAAAGLYGLNQVVNC